MLHKDLEDVLRIWQKKLACYERELSITASSTQKFELKERIKECQEEIKRLRQEISTNSQSEVPIPIISPTLPRKISCKLGRNRIRRAGIPENLTPQLLGKNYPDTPPSIPQPVVPVPISELVETPEPVFSGENTSSSSIENKVD